MHPRTYALPLFLIAGALHAQGPEVTSWILNQGETGSYYVQGNSTPIVTTTLANVQLVQYADDNVYINATGIPAYPTAPFLDGNPSLAGSNDYLFRIPRNPQAQTGTLTDVPLGHIGVLKNGVPIFNAEDAMSYNGQGIWLRNAVYWENDGMDCSKGHPAPNMGGGGQQMGRYHQHQNPAPFSTASVLLSSICTLYPSTGLYTPDPADHSPLLGYAFDGFPIYGCFGYSDPLDAASPITRIQSSWQLRNITVRQTLADGTVLPAGETGEIWTWTPAVIDRYLNAPPLGPDTLDDRGFFRTGDMGRLDEDGFLYISDRAKDMIIAGGVNIYPAEIEHVLQAHPAVADAAVIGIPDDEMGERVLAFCELKPGRHATPNELIAHCGASLATYKRPREIRIVDELPRNTIGKLLKRELRAPFWKDRDRLV